MNFFRKIIERFKKGYPIGGGFFLLPKTHDNIVLNYSSFSFDIFLESRDHVIVIFASTSSRLMRENSILFDESIFAKGIDFLSSHYKELGKSVKIE